LNSVDFAPLQTELDAFLENDENPPLHLWEDKYLVTLPCSNARSLIKFLFVPFIVEEDEIPDGEKDWTEQNSNKIFVQSKDENIAFHEL
jgi:hypothetical protein